MRYTPPPKDYSVGEREYEQPDPENCSIGLVDSNPVIEFTNSDVGLIEEWGLRRTKEKNKSDDYSDMDNARGSTLATNSPYYNSVEQIHEAGVAGELAFAKYYGFPFPYSPEEQLDDGWDFAVRLEETGDWLTVDVKATKVSGSKLTMQDTKSLRADLYCLVEYNDYENAELLGWTTAAFFADCPITGSANQYTCHRDRLTPMWEKSESTAISYETYQEHNE